MESLQARLRRELEGARTVAVLAVGSALRGDDAAGLLAAERLEKDYKPASGCPSVAVLVAGTTPENLTGELKRLQPTHVIVIDAADMGEKAGHVALIEPAALGLGKIVIERTADQERRIVRVVCVTSHRRVPTVHNLLLIRPMKMHARELTKVRSPERPSANHEFRHPHHPRRNIHQHPSYHRCSASISLSLLRA